jgi:hypothetical protein
LIINIYQMISKLNKASYIIRFLKPLRSLESLKMVYFSTVHSIISYGIIFWGSSTHTKIMFKIQKRVIRIITNSGNKDSCRDLRNYLFFHSSLNKYFLHLCLLLRMKIFSKWTRMFILLIQDSIMIYISQW